MGVYVIWFTLAGAVIGALYGLFLALKSKKNK
ncbi:MAG: LPXTG cell wall anchor domain-containing protein [Eubacteriales bacterium]|nr:LPXTG cell wall anchor domain-containing protein [Eubacteriales bacterium]